MRMFILGMVSLLVVLTMLAIATPGKAYPDELEDNIVYLGYDYEATETTLYVGQEYVGSTVWLGLPTDSFLLTLDSPMMEDPTYHSYPGPFEPGFRVHYGVYPMDGTPPGQYPVTAYLNYTLLNGSRHQRVFEFTVDYVIAWEVIEFKVNKDRELVLELETYIELYWISVDFHSRSPHRLEEYEFKEFNVTPGTHRFEAAFVQDGRNLPDTNYTVGYTALAFIISDTLKLEELDVTFDISEEEGLSTWAYAIIGLVLAPTTVVVLMLLLKTRGRPKEGGDDRRPMDNPPPPGS